MKLWASCPYLLTLSSFDTRRKLLLRDVFSRRAPLSAYDARARLPLAEGTSFALADTEEHPSGVSTKTEASVMALNPYQRKPVAPRTTSSV